MVKKTRFGIIDYGMGNLQSVANAFRTLGCNPVLLSNASSEWDATDAIILPGVGAFGEAMRNLRKSHAADLMKNQVLEKKKPFLGICLGMHLIFEDSEEFGFHKGLGWLPGSVKKMASVPELRLPHMGWNTVHFKNKSPLFKDIPDKNDFYFVHSYVVECEHNLVTSETTYGKRFPASIQSDHIFATQFHLEKSSKAGLHMLKNFIKYVNRC